VQVDDVLISKGEHFQHLVVCIDAHVRVELDEQSCIGFIPRHTTFGVANFVLKALDYSVSVEETGAGDEVADACESSFSNGSSISPSCIICKKKLTGYSTFFNTLLTKSYVKSLRVCKQS
jgi:hypothetical protein